GRKGVTGSLIARTVGNPRGVAALLQTALAGVVPGTAPKVKWLREQYGVAARVERGAFVAAIFLLFAIVGVALAALGVYGIVAHSADERRREGAVRLSLGATPAMVVRLFLREGNVVALGGVAVGLICSRATGGWLSYFVIEDAGFSAQGYAAMG